MTEPDYRMPAGLGVIEWQGRTLVYQMGVQGIAWARPLGDACIDIDESLRAAIEADHRKNARIPP